MKVKSILFLILLANAAMLFMAVQCSRKEEIPALPPETQEGKNTFGCYINGELFIKRKASLFVPNNPLVAIYYRETKRLVVDCEAWKNLGFMQLHIDNPHEGEMFPLSLGFFTYRSHPFGCEDRGEIFITKFDTVNNIVSGIFEFTGREASFYGYPERITYTGDSTAQVTDGRFDVKLQIYELEIY